MDVMSGPLPDATVRWADHQDGLLDVHLPDGRLPTRAAGVVLLVHGGFWKAAYDRHHTRAQARALADRGRRGQIVAELNQDPNRFLAAVQVGVTTAGFLSAAFGGATLADDLSPVLVDAGVADRFADSLALVLVTLAISYLSLVLGELTAWSAHRTGRVVLRTATKNQLLGQLDRTFPGLTLALPNVLATKVGRLVAADDEDRRDV